MATLAFVCAMRPVQPALPSPWHLPARRWLLGVQGQRLARHRMKTHRHPPRSALLSNLSSDSGSVETLRSMILAAVSRSGGSAATFLAVFTISDRPARDGWLGRDQRLAGSEMSEDPQGSPVDAMFPSRILRAVSDRLRLCCCVDPRRMGRMGPARHKQVRGVWRALWPLIDVDHLHFRAARRPMGATRRMRLPRVDAGLAGRRGQQAEDSREPSSCRI
ncbi:uncharacterized protein BDZ99DRAFT_576201 [Mytilinidion resinicola]|uniref:Uncharacterized protein n=1 Tax=Mytilinidion resinicola TaxID=574789 RepID=A0A6A6Y3T1_9PEZI|nr:uncharacterized protein BDZ99DRAFT_576201 [Mytilinidion resinicola]KAF2803289.1 hypothetical protein BDZ99DRAFT_576201 [Mytilinidion resinicola]